MMEDEAKVHWCRHRNTAIRTVVDDAGNIRVVPGVTCLGSWCVAWRPDKPREGHCSLGGLGAPF